MGVIRTILDIFFGTFSSFFRIFSEISDRISESGLAPSWALLIFQCICIAVFMGSPFAAASIAESRGRSRLLHFIPGLLIPWVYPVLIFFFLPRHREISDEEDEEDEASEPESAPKSAISKFEKNTKDGEPSGDVSEVNEVNQHNITIVSRDENGNPVGPLILEFNDGRMLEVAKIQTPLPQQMVVEIRELDGKTRTVRFPYAQIKSCRRSSEEDTEGDKIPDNVEMYQVPEEKRGNILSINKENDLSILETGKIPVEQIQEEENRAIKHVDKHIMISPGTTINNCEIDVLLGKGGMSTVYKGRHRMLDIPVAIKILSAEINEELDSTERFLREAKYAAKIKHDNLVSVMDAGKDEVNSFYYIIMEYVEGRNIKDIVEEDGPMDEEDAILVTLSVASALVVVSEQNIVHRDIKPENIMLDQGGLVKLADLGIAKQTIAAETEETDLTQNTTIMGSPAFMSPEQANNFKDVDIRTDIYSLGASLFYMLTGEFPFRGDNVISTLTKLIHEPTPDPRTLNPGISEETASLCMKMMAKKTGDRYQSAGELVSAINNLINS